MTNYIIALDVETIDTAKNLGSIGMSKINLETDEEVDHYYTLINNENREVDYGYIHGLTEEMLRDAPRFREVADEIWDFIDGHVIVAHNAVTADVGPLLNAFDRIRFDRAKLRKFKFIDSLGLAKAIFPNFKSKGLAQLAGTFKLKLDHHNALADARVCGKLLTIMLHGTKTATVDDLLAGFRFEYGTYDNQSFRRKPVRKKDQHLYKEPVKHERLDKRNEDVTALFEVVKQLNDPLLLPDERKFYQDQFERLKKDLS